MKRKQSEIKTYDSRDTTQWIDLSRPLSLKKLGVKLFHKSPIKLILAKSTKRLMPV